MGMAVRCFVSFPLDEGRRWTAPALVRLDTAQYLQERGWWMLRDPADEAAQRDLRETYWADVRRHLRPHD